MSKLTYLAAALACGFLAGCGADPPAAGAADPHGHDGDDAHDATGPPEGPRGGRLLVADDFALELTMFEEGVPPEYRAYVTRGGQPVPPAGVQLAVELARFGGRIDRIGFEPQADYLRSTSTIEEPHSFEVRITATEGGRTHTFAYESLEGRTTIAADMARGAGIGTAVAGPGRIEERLTLFGSIQADADRVRAVSARFPGLIRSVDVKVGDTVRPGQPLATVESNDSLRVYDVTAPIAGVITERNANPGETTGDGHLFEVADFSSVRADLNVFPRDRGRLRAGQAVRVSAADGGQSAAGQIDFIAPAGSMANQSLIARVLLDNRAGLWTPGQFVEGQVVVASTEIPLAVAPEAIQTFRDWQVVFVNIGDDYEVRPLELGRSDADTVEVLAGLQPGERYVAAGSYVVKADIEKSGASHDH
jgi:cobalt-zinc-cadmium efflux system membrane fusion protein